MAFFFFLKEEKTHKINVNFPFWHIVKFNLCLELKGNIPSVFQMESAFPCSWELVTPVCNCPLSHSWAMLGFLSRADVELIYLRTYVVE